jgi:hypothetical protein
MLKRDSYPLPKQKRKLQWDELLPEARQVSLQGCVKVVIDSECKILIVISFE